MSFQLFADFLLFIFSICILLLPIISILCFCLILNTCFVTFLVLYHISKLLKYTQQVSLPKRSKKTSQRRPPRIWRASTSPSRTAKPRSWLGPKTTSSSFRPHPSGKFPPMVTVRLSSTTLFLLSLSGRLLSQPPESMVCFFFYVKSTAFDWKKSCIWLWCKKLDGCFLLF